MDLDRLRKMARTHYNKHYDGGHPSFAAERALLWAAEKAGFDHYGCEGYCDSVGNRGVTYLNKGDPYTTTVYAVTSHNGARFVVGAWGDHAERCAWAR